MTLDEFRNQVIEVQRLTAVAQGTLRIIRGCMDHKTGTLHGAKLSDFLLVSGDARPNQIQLEFQGVRLLFRIEVPFGEGELSAFIVGYRLSEDIPKERELPVRYRLDRHGNSFSVAQNRERAVAQEQMPQVFFTDLVTTLADGSFVLKPS